MCTRIKTILFAVNNGESSHMTRNRNQVELRSGQTRPTRATNIFYLFVCNVGTAERDVRRPKLVSEGAGICLVSFRFCEWFRPVPHQVARHQVRWSSGDPACDVLCCSRRRHRDGTDLCESVYTRASSCELVATSFTLAPLTHPDKRNN